MFDIPPGRLVNGTTAFFTFTTLGYAQFVLNFHASLVRVEPSLASSLIVFCADEDTARAFDSTGVFTVDCGAAGLPDFADFETAGFGQVVSYKYRLARALLEHAQYAWWCDGDIVVRAPIAERITSLMEEHQCDLLMQHEWPGDVHNVGFWVAKGSPVVEEVLADMIAHTSTAGVNDDQAYFNEAVAGRPGLDIRLLDPDEFMCGNRFYYRHLVHEPRGSVLHFNYSIGSRSKKALMMGHGRWYLPERAGASIAARLRYVVVAVSLRMGIDLLGDDVGADVPGPRACLRRLLGRVRAAGGRMAGGRAGDRP